MANRNDPQLKLANVRVQADARRLTRRQRNLLVAAVWLDETLRRPLTRAWVTDQGYMDPDSTLKILVRRRFLRRKARGVYVLTAGGRRVAAHLR